jgi:hypothetical protein
MKTIFCSLIFIIYCDVSLASGSYVGNGGDTIVCRSSSDNIFEGHYTLDYLIEYRETPQGLVKIDRFSDTIYRLNNFLAVTYPELQSHFNQFVSAVRTNHPSSGRHWIPEVNGLVDIKDENIQKLIPANCLSENEGAESLKLYQTVIREPSKDPIQYHYDQNILEELELKNPLQFSFFIVHEWLWDLSHDVRSVRKLNWLLHSESLKDMKRNELAAMFNRFDIFKIKLDFCERSSQIKELMDLSCEKVTLVDLSQIKAVKISSALTTPFRIGDFFGFGRLEKLSLSGLNLSTFDILPRLFYPLYKLRSLDLSHNKLSSISDQVSVDLMDLENLDLSYNPLTKIPAALRQLTSLKSLTLSADKELFNDVKNIENLPTDLKNLTLINNKLASRDIETIFIKIQQSKPNLQIIVKNDF